MKNNKPREYIPAFLPPVYRLVPSLGFSIYMEVDVVELINHLLFYNGIIPKTHSYADYELCKSKIYEEAYRRYKIDYDEFVKIVVEYLGL